MGKILDITGRLAHRTGPVADAHARFAAAIRAVGGRTAMARELTDRLEYLVRGDVVQAWEERVVPPADVLLAAEAAAGERRATVNPSGPITAAVMTAAHRHPSPAILDTITAAVDADRILEYAVTVAVGEVRDLARHPLASRVMTRAASDLLAWPFTGRTPTVLSAVESPSPVVSTADRVAFFDHHREAIARAAVDYPGAADMQPMRQALYFTQWDDDTPVQDAAGGAWRPDLGWTPRWVAARSLAVTAARRGDPGPLHRFVTDGLDGRPDCQDADLAYWALWVGEDTSTWATDQAMTAGLRTDGRLLLDRLIAGILPGDPILDLTVRSCRALLDRRPMLRRDPAVRARMRRHVRAVIDSPDVTPDTRRILSTLAR